MVNGKFVLHHSKQRKGDTDYIYHMIAWYFRKNNKPIRQTIKYLGRLNEREIEFYRDQLLSLNNILSQSYRQEDKNKKGKKNKRSKGKYKYKTEK